MILQRRKNGKEQVNMNKLFTDMPLVFILLFPAGMYAQNYDTGSIFKEPVSLDSFVIKSGFDVNGFIRRVRSDTTFYKAFRSMHLVPYDAVNDILVYGKNGGIIASMHSKTKQKRDKGCRTTGAPEENITGDFYKRDGSYRYYTAELFAYLFFAKQPVCNENDIVSGAMEVHGKGQLEKSKYELKQLIFNPGVKVSGVPFMGDRASIFDQGEAEKYDFRITQQMYEGQECYVFSITPKSGYEHKVIYNELTTWFRKNDYSIVARDYSLSYSTLVYDFDVRMKVRTKQVGAKLYPTYIDYNGNWHIITKKRERVKFTVSITY
ncbi:MAG: hypothetical protein ACHP6H_02355 [Legionellales bacterium]